MLFPAPGQSSLTPACLSPSWGATEGTPTGLSPPAHVGGILGGTKLGLQIRIPVLPAWHQQGSWGSRTRGEDQPPQLGWDWAGAGSGHRGARHGSSREHGKEKSSCAGNYGRG